MTPDLEDDIAQLETIKTEGKAVAGGLTEAQFNWRPGEGRWSVAECLQHLNVAVSRTLPAFDRAIAEGRAQGKRATGPFRYGWFARWMVPSMEPPPKRRMGTFKIFALPAGTTYHAANVLPEFLSIRDQLADRVRPAEGVDPSSIQTAPPAAPQLRPPPGGHFQCLI